MNRFMISLERFETPKIIRKLTQNAPYGNQGVTSVLQTVLRGDSYPQCGCKLRLSWRVGIKIFEPRESAGLRPVNLFGLLLQHVGIYLCRSAEKRL